jgi:hypothetical protein
MMKLEVTNADLELAKREIVDPLKERGDMEHHEGCDCTLCHLEAFIKKNADREWDKLANTMGVIMDPIGFILSGAKINGTQNLAMMVVLAVGMIIGRAQAEREQLEKLHVIK